MVGQCREALGLSGTRWRHHPGRARRQSLIQRHLQPSCTVVRIQAFIYNIYNFIQRHLQPSCIVGRIHVYKPLHIIYTMLYKPFSIHIQDSYIRHTMTQNSYGIATPTIQYSLCYHYLPSRRSITQLWLAPISFNIHFV